MIYNWQQENWGNFQYSSNLHFKTEQKFLENLDSLLAIEESLDKFFEKV